MSLTGMRVRRDLIIVLAACTLSLLYIATAGGGFPLDDSWIHQTYARNLAQFGEWAYTPSIPSTASTSPLYTILLSSGYRLGIPFGLWTHGLGIVSLIVTGLVGARLADRLLPEMRSIGLFAGLALTCAWHLLWAAASGMETMIFSMWTIVLVWLAWMEMGKGSHAAHDWRPYAARGAIFGMCAGLATLTRPEGILLVGLIGLAIAVTRPGMSWGTLAVYGVMAAVACGLVLAPYLSFNWQITGGLLPNTAASKRADLAALFLAPYLDRVVDLLIPLAAGGQILLLPGLVMFAASKLMRLAQDRSSLLLLVPMLWSLSLILLYAAYLPAYFQHGRYVIPSLPGAILCGVVGTGLIVRQGGRSRFWRLMRRVLVLATVAVYAAFALTLGLQAYVTDVEIIDNEMVRTAQWMADSLPTSELLAIHDIGAVGYFASRPIIDLAGLVNPELLPIIPVENHGEATWAILRARDARYVMGFADQLPGGNPDDARLCPIFRARGEDAPVSDTFNMSVYRIVWDGRCQR